MSRRIGDNELALVCREETIRNIDRDALLTLCGKTINKKRKIKIIALGAKLFAISLKRCQLIFEDQL